MGARSEMRYLMQCGKGKQGYKMRKIIFACAFVFVGAVCHATEMCARNDTVIVPLEAANNGLSSGYNNNEFTWWVDFDFGRIYGYSTCLSADEGLGRTGTMGAYYGTGEYANAFINVDPGLTGTDANGNERKYCWCKMTHPASSRWVFSYAHASASHCVSHCASYCGNHVRILAAMRGGVYRSVGL